jgi:pyruvate, orthophosphate dikinase
MSCFGVHSARAANDDPDKMMYTFKRGEAEGTKEMKHTLGGKGAGLQEVAALGLNVPPGFTITTSACERYQSKGESFVNVDLWPDVLRGITFLEKTSSRTLFRSGCTPITRLPLFVSVRSGAAASMPGMMDSILDIGFNDESCEACIAAGIDSRFVYDSYRRLLHMFGDVVEGIPSEDFARALDAKKKSIGASTDAELTSDALRELCDDFKRIYEKHKIKFEQNPLEQLRKSIVSVFKSWNNPRAVTYRKINNITTLRGTAVNVQQMAYGNLDDNSGSGVCFTSCFARKAKTSCLARGRQSTFLN